MAATTEPNECELLDTAEAARLLGISPGTLQVWRCVGRHGLPYVRVGRRVKYVRKDIDRWIKSRTVCALSNNE